MIDPEKISYSEATEQAAMEPASYADFLALAVGIKELLDSPSTSVYEYPDDGGVSFEAESIIDNRQLLNLPIDLYICLATIKGTFQPNQPSPFLSLVYRESVFVPGVDASQTSFDHTYAIRTHQGTIIETTQHFWSPATPKLAKLSRGYEPIHSDVEYRQAQEGEKILHGLFTGVTNQLTVGDCEVLYDRIKAMR